jgi:hypothetical protein
VIILNNAPADPNFDSSTDETTGFKTVSFCAAPIIGALGGLVGVIEMVNKIPVGYRTGQRFYRFI